MCRKAKMHFLIKCLYAKKFKFWTYTSVNIYIFLFHPLVFSFWYLLIFGWLYWIFVPFHFTFSIPETCPKSLNFHSFWYLQYPLLWYLHLLGPLTLTPCKEHQFQMLIFSCLKHFQLSYHQPFWKFQNQTA